MDVTRAKSIIVSADHIKVYLDDEPVWIESVDSGTQTATVHLQNGSDETRTVNLEQLRENKHAPIDD
ncbi:H-type small acid-soluble spore protein [Paenibacillus sp. y28]|uniref:H-type small acid-soluble spore protein n=1 Tax=Paenibacillus sp. y28 TaxID=3129110 RepID=UPI0030174EBF